MLKDKIKKKIQLKKDKNKLWPTWLTYETYSPSDETMITTQKKKMKSNYQST